MSQVELVSYPKVHQRPDGRVELVVRFQGKRMRIQNGRSFGITLKPNSFPHSERLNQGNILAAQVYSKLIGGYNPFHSAVKNKIVNLSDLSILEKALDKKVNQGVSKHYATQLHYSLNSLKKNLVGGMITENSIEKTLDHFDNKTSYNTMRRGLVVLFNSANELGWNKNPINGIKNKRTKAKLNKPYDDVYAILESIKAFNENLYLCCLLTYGCLLRPHREVRELTWGDFSEDLNYIRLSGARNKSGRNRIVPVPNYIKAILKKSNKNTNIFTGNEKAPNDNYFKTLWGRYRKVSSLIEKDHTLYSFRHSGAIDIYKRTGSLTKLQKAMGHSTINVSLIYLRGLEVSELEISDMPVLVRL